MQTSYFGKKSVSHPTFLREPSILLIFLISQSFHLIAIFTYLNYVVSEDIHLFITKYLFLYLHNQTKTKIFFQFFKLIKLSCISNYTGRYGFAEPMLSPFFM